MDGILLIDKPSGPTSHDVVASIRRAADQRAVGHTGTLDPLATGLLPLVLGRATRLSAWLTGGDKTYEAAVRLGFGTDTDDGEGRRIGEPGDALPSDDQITAALDQFRGVFDQVPPSHSAKRIGGEKAYDLARRSKAVVLDPVTVTVRRLDLLGRDSDIVRLRITATSGFYVRALARDLGTHLGCGGHLAALRRTHSGPFRVADALSLEDAERLGSGVAAHLVTPAAALPTLEAVSVTAAGLRRAIHGNALGPGHVEGGWVAAVQPASLVKILAADGHLVALAQPRAGALHPVVVLG